MYGLLLHEKLPLLITMKLFLIIVLGGLRHVGDFGGMSHRNHTFRNDKVRTDKFQRVSAKQGFIQDFVLGEVRGCCVGGVSGGGRW